MKKIFIVMLLICASFSFAQSIILEDIQTVEIENLRDILVSDTLGIDEQIEAYYHPALESIEKLQLSDDERDFLIYIANFYAGIIYNRNDFEQCLRNVKGKRTKLKDLDDAGKAWKFKAEEHVEKAFNGFVALEAEIKDSPDLYIFIARSNSLLCTLKPLSYLIKNMGNTSDYADSALELDNDNFYATHIKMRGLIYMPKAFGGDPELAVGVVGEILDLHETEVDPYFLFNLYIDLSIGYAALKEEDKSLEYTEKALALYKDNNFMRAFKQILLEG